MEKKFNFIYLTTNLKNGKQYIGDHSTDRIFDNYLGSGRPYFQNALKEYGRENFKREILEFFETKEEAFKAQERYIVECNTLVPNGYNISPTGGHNTRGCWSEESKKKMADLKRGKKLSEETKKKISKSSKGKKLSEETILKMSSSHKGLKVLNETKEKISKGMKGVHLGKKLTDEHKKNISKSMKNCPVA